MKKNRLFILAVSALLLGCGAPTDKATTPANASDSTALNPAQPGAGAEATHESDATQGVFKDMAFGERKAFMTDVVMPEMKPLFIENHPDFSCISCHGEDLTAINYEMPNTLAPLNPAAMPFESDDEKIRAAARFMKEKVVPKMADLLTVPPYNPETKSGFGCFDCHATAAK